MSRQPLLLQFVILVAVVALFMGCGRARYDARLVQADSLMWTAPDSALAIVSAIDSLAGEANQAYRDLLTTQARYKTYADITASDDSAITRAMRWYRSHSGEREKLTRACLYKGAVMEELGHVDSAMYYYKTAEAAADTTDYLNLGQINMRIGDLYRIYDGNEQTCYEKYQLANKYYCIIGNKKNQFYSWYYMFMMEGITHQQYQQKNEDFLNAFKTAKELQDDLLLFKILELRCRQLSRVDSTCNKAKQIALYCFNDFEQYINNDLLIDLAYLYTFENKLDSAKYYIGNVDESLNPDDEKRLRLRKYEVLSMIAAREEHDLIAEQFLSKEAQLTDSIMDCTEKYIIERIENEFNNQRHNDNTSRISRLKWGIIMVALIAFLLIALLTLAYLRRIQHTKAIIMDLENTKIDNYDYLLNLLDSKSAVIEQFLANLVTLIKSITGNDAHNSTSQLAHQIKETITEVANDDFWNELRSYLDKRHNGLISNLAQTHNLAGKDLHFIELCLCGFSNVVIALIMGYSPKYTSNKRRILSEKLGIVLYFKAH